MYRLRRQTKTYRQIRANTEHINHIYKLKKLLETMTQEYNHMHNKGDYSKKYYHYQRYIDFLKNRIDANLKHI